MTKILHVVGTRPQYIKLYPLYQGITKLPDIEQRIYDTGQHYDKHMSQDIIDEFQLQDISTGSIAGLGPEQQIPLMIGNIWTEIAQKQPDYIFVYGDTNSTLAASVAAAKIGIPFGHIEAGVRTDKDVGVQEGINRNVADALATHHFCVNAKDYENLLREGREKNNVHLVGDLMADAFRSISATVHIENTHPLKNGLLVTIHRAENVDNDQVRVKLVKVLAEVSKTRNLIWPIHPRLNSKFTDIERETLQQSNISLTNPMKYSDIVRTLAQVDGVITDSGGLPKDAAYAGVKSLVLRKDPIWMELAELGYISTTADLPAMSMDELLALIGQTFDGRVPPYEPQYATRSIIEIVRKYIQTK